VYAIYSCLLGVLFLLIALQRRNRHWEIHTPTDLVENGDNGKAKHTKMGSTKRNHEKQSSVGDNESIENTSI
jgi:hypothetical protein